MPQGTTLKTFAGDKKSLTALLASILAAAKVSPAVDQLLESKRIFSPCALTVRQEYQSVHGFGLIEQANIVVQHANFWKAAFTKAAVSAKLNLKNRKDDARGVDNLLSFFVSAVLDGQPLALGELQEPLDCSDGLIRFGANGSVGFGIVQTELKLTRCRKNVGSRSGKRRSARSIPCCR